MTSIALASEAVVPFESFVYEHGEAFMRTRNQLGLLMRLRGEREMTMAKYGVPISYQGFCSVCRRATEFTCGWDLYDTLADGRRVPSWRERLVCVHCGLSSRLRASLHFMEWLGGFNERTAVYLSEQTTPFYKLVSKRCANLVGSEYLRDGTKKGEANKAGLRHEDITTLTFSSDQFDYVGSFEVLEHVPDYYAGLAEMYRVLKPGGSLVASFPFRVDLLETLVRARVDDSGYIKHLLPAEYHGDPISSDGVLCFYHFGWDILDKMREIGFSHATCHYYWSWEVGYLGGALPLFHAIK